MRSDRLPYFLDIVARHHFIEEHDLRLGCKDPGDFQSFLLRDRQGDGLQVEFVRKNRRDPRPPRPGLGRPFASVSQESPDHDIFQDTHILEDPDDLKGPADTVSAGGFRVFPCYVLSLKRILPFVAL